MAPPLWGMTARNHGNTSWNHANWMKWLWQLTLLWVRPFLARTPTHKYSNKQSDNRVLNRMMRDWYWVKRNEKRSAGEEEEREAGKGTCIGVTDTAFLIFKQKEMLWMFHALLNNLCPVCGVAVRVCTQMCVCVRACTPNMRMHVPVCVICFAPERSVMTIICKAPAPCRAQALCSTLRRNISAVRNRK